MRRGIAGFIAVALWMLTMFAFAPVAMGSSDVMSDLRSFKTPEGAMWMEKLDIGKMVSGGQGPRAGLNAYGLPMSIGGVGFRRGIGTYADSFFLVNLKGAATKFAAMVGVNDNIAGGSVNFEVWVDGKKATTSGVMRSGDKPRLMEVDLTGAKAMYLLVDNTDDGNSNDVANWGGALLYLAPGATEKPEAVTPQTNEPAMPIAHTDPNALGIHGPRVVGTSTGKPFVFLIPATGKAPLKYAAKGLPAGLKLDANTGVVEGAVAKDGKYIVELSVDAANGKATRKLTILAGKDKLARTPPMGWNSWNVWGLAVDDAKVRAAADVMIRSGLAAHGYQYVNIDDGWELNRAANGEILTNEKFPDMKSTADYVHSKGLRFGIYSSPGPRTCGGYEGSWKHEYQDAASYAKWGVDYLKHDWCSYGTIASNTILEELKKPYTLMKDALDKSGRDIVLSMCQYGMGDVWKWGAGVGGNLWRTTGDIVDTWGSMAGIGFGQSGIAKHAGPGHWNDPDMLVVGRVGWGPSVHPTRLTPNEQITHITLWSMLAAPLLIGADMENLDAFTLDLLTNDDVLDVNQDILGRQASRVSREGMLEVWARPLADGTTAVALFNRFFEKSEITAKWSDIGVKGAQPVRDLWLRKDAGVFKDSYKAMVPAHGAVMIKVGKPKPID